MENQRKQRGHVVVVGCGIAGAAAANRLHRNGFEVTVLEAESRIGGRTSTKHQDGFKIDLAAPLLLTRYTRKGVDYQNPVLAADLHYGDVREYADVCVGSAELRDYLIDPACRFMGLASLQDTSAVDFLMLAKNMGKTALFNSPEGIDTLARLLVADAKVETDAEVTAIAENAGGVTITWDRPGESSHEITADACVITVQ